MRLKFKKPELIFIVFLAVVLALCIISTLTSSRKIEEVYRFKYWTINFKDKINMDDFIKYNIKVTDSKGKDVPISLNWGENRQSIIICPPQDGYNVGETYSIKLNSNTSYTIGNINSNNKTKKFKVKDLADNQTVISFKDKNLEEAVRKEINKSNGDIHRGDIENVTSLIVTSSNISDLTGIENLVNLRLLALDMNSISNINPLSKLNSLEVLGLSNNNISDVSSLSGLTNLRRLSLYRNPVKSYKPIKNISKQLEWKDFK